MSVDAIASRPEILTGSSGQPTLKKAAQEFEALFVAQLLKIMRESGLSSELFGSAPGQEIYREMMDQEVARALVAKGGLGLARMLEEHLAGDSGALRDVVRETVGDLSRSRPAPQPLSIEMPGGVQDRFQMTSGMGWRRDPFTGELKYHRGVDLAAPAGTDVTAVQSGTVVFSGVQGSYGKTIVIKDASGVQTRYAHLSELNVKKGQEVSRGEVLGKVGKSGRATGPHLHLEMERNGRSLNPLGRHRGWDDRTNSQSSIPE